MSSIQFIDRFQIVTTFNFIWANYLFISTAWKPKMSLSFKSKDVQPFVNKLNTLLLKSCLYKPVTKNIILNTKINSCINLNTMAIVINKTPHVFLWSNFNYMSMTILLNY